MQETQEQISSVCDSIKDLLLLKNKKYGDSALSPTRIFSNASPVEQLLVRIDDKLSRISKGAGLLSSDEDVITDLIGYLVLLKIALNREPREAWDGSDIDAFPCPKATAKKLSNSCSDGFREAKDVTSSGLDGQELLRLHSSGDRFA